jgi:tetratricopeptide (TPR) repeat protein
MTLVDDRPRESEKEMIKECFIDNYIWTLDYQDLKGTRKRLEQILKFYPESYTSYLYLGLLEIFNDLVSAKYHFDKALTFKPDLEQAWYYKGLISIIQHEFKIALNHFEKVISINSQNYRAQSFKIDLLFYLKKFDKLEQYYLEVFKQRINDLDFLKYEMVCTNEGVVFGEIIDISDEYITIRKHIVIDLETGIKKSFIEQLIPKDKIMTVGEVIMLNVTGKEDIYKSSILDEKPPFVIDSHGFFIGELKEIEGDMLTINIGFSTEMRFFNLLNQDKIKIPSSGIISRKKGLMIYDIKQLDPKYIIRNSDAASFLRRVFEYSDPFSRYIPIFNEDLTYPHPVKYYGL